MAAELPSDRVAIRDIENARGVRLDRRIGMAALCVGRVTMRATFPPIKPPGGLRRAREPPTLETPAT